MAEINFQDGYRIKSDNHQWIVQHLVGVKTKEWLSISYHVTLKSAFYGLLRRLSRDSNATTLTSLLEEIKNAKNSLSHDLSIITNISDLLGED